MARVVVVLCLVAAGILLPSPAVAQGLPRAMAAIPVGGVIPAPTAGSGHAPVSVQRLVVAVEVHAERPRLALMPARVTAVLDARYTLRLPEGQARPQHLTLRVLATPDVAVRWDGRPVDLYAAPDRPGDAVATPEGAGGEPAQRPSPAAGAAAGGVPDEPSAESQDMVHWLDPLTGRFYPVPQAMASSGAPQALALDVALRPERDHHLQLHYPRVPLGWDGGRYIAPVHQLIVPLHPEAWAGFGPVDVHVAVPRGYVADLAGAPPAAEPSPPLGDDGAESERAALGPAGERRWARAPAQIHVAAVDTAGMWGRWVTRRRDVLWLLATTWLVFVGLRAGLWRLGRRRDAWAWAALLPLLALPVVAGWVSWRSLRVPLWGYPLSLLQYALWGALALYVAGRLLGDLVGFLALRWRYRRAAGPPRGPGTATSADELGQGSHPAVAADTDAGGLTAPSGGA